MHQMDGVRLSPVLPSNKGRPENTVNLQAPPQSDVEANAVEAEGPDEILPPDRSRMWIKESVFLGVCMVSFTSDDRLETHLLIAPDQCQHRQARLWNLWT